MNIFTPSFTYLTISTLLSIKALSKSVVQSNLLPGFSNSLNGAIIVPFEKAYATWLISPNQVLISLMFLGVGKSKIFCRYLGQP